MSKSYFVPSNRTNASKTKFKSDKFPNEINNVKIALEYLIDNNSGEIDLTDYAKKTEIPKSASDVGADATGTATTKVTEHNISASSHSDIRLLIEALTNKLNTMFSFNDNGELVVTIGDTTKIFVAKE